MQTDCFPDSVVEWPKVPVSKLAKVNPRYTGERGRDYPFVEMASVGEHFAGILRVHRRKLEGSGLTRFKARDTLFAKITPCPENGKVAFVSELPDTLGLGSTEFIVLSPHSETNPRFLYHLVCSHPVRGRAVARMEGSTGRQRVPEEVFVDRLHVPMPPPTEQATIVTILDAVDTALERTLTSLDHSRRVHHSLLHELLAKGIGPQRSGEGHYPKHWKLTRVDEVATVGSGVTLGKDVAGERTANLPYLRVANVQDGRLDLSTVKTVRVPVGDVPKFRLEAGDVLMTEGGDIDKLGRGTIWEAQIPDCLHQNHVFRIRPNREVLEPAFYALVVESDFAKRYFSRVAKRTTNLASTNKTQVRAFRFPLPPSIDEQREIVKIVAQAKAQSLALSMKEAGLRKLKQSLMHDLLTGKVRVGEVTEASAL